MFLVLPLEICTLRPSGREMYLDALSPAHKIFLNKAFIPNSLFGFSVINPTRKIRYLIGRLSQGAGSLVVIWGRFCGMFEKRLRMTRPFVSPLAGCFEDPRVYESVMLL